MGHLTNILQVITAHITEPKVNCITFLDVHKVYLITDVFIGFNR